jgi:hypothetical protein
MTDLLKYYDPTLGCPYEKDLKNEFLYSGSPSFEGHREFFDLIDNKCSSCDRVCQNEVQKVRDKINALFEEFKKNNTSDGAIKVLRGLTKLKEEFPNVNIFESNLIRPDAFIN